jgi:hypothetical protein
MIIKAVYNLALIVASVILLVTSVPLLASIMDHRVASSARSSSVFDTFLKGDAVNILLKGDIVTLIGAV